MNNYRRALRELAERYGRIVEITNGGHVRLVARGKVPIIAARSPTNPYRSLRNVRALLRRHDKVTR